MDKAWVEKKQAQAYKEYCDGVATIAEYIRNSYNNQDWRREAAKNILNYNKMIKDDKVFDIDWQNLAQDLFSFLFLNEEATKFGKQLCSNISTPYSHHSYDIYLDSKFNLPAGDYIVTDPCYLEKGYDELNWWSDEFEKAMPSLHQRSTIYGDWGCTMFDVTNIVSIDRLSAKECYELAIGRFCADAGQVCIVSYEDVDNYNPKFIAELEDPKTENRHATIIRNFKGKAGFEVREEEFEYKGERNLDYVVIVWFDGVDTETGNIVRYESRQTSL